MKARITNAFAKAKAEGRGAFVAYLTMGYPSIAASEQAVDDVIAGGADVVEFGVPFSDPFADGGVIRSAAYEALKQGVTLDDIIALAKRLRAKHPETGFVLFSYYNLIFSKGLKNFADAVADAGIDAVLSVDLPLEERDELLSVLAPRDVSYVPLIAPNTPIERVLPPDLTDRLDAIRAVSHLPVAAGFGISTKAQADEVSRHADGFIVGSALVKCLAEGKKPCLA